MGYFSKNTTCKGSNFYYLFIRIKLYFIAKNCNFSFLVDPLNAAVMCMTKTYMNFRYFVVSKIYLSCYHAGNMEICESKSSRSW